MALRARCNTKSQVALTVAPSAPTPLAHKDGGVRAGGKTAGAAPSLGPGAAPTPPPPEGAERGLPPRGGRGLAARTAVGTEVVTGAIKTLGLFGAGLGSDERWMSGLVYSLWVVGWK